MVYFWSETAEDNSKIIEISYVIEITRDLSKEEARKHVMRVREEDLRYFFHERLPKMPSIDVMEIILASPFEDVIYDAAANVRTPTSVLQKLYEKKGSDKFLLTLLAQNPSTNREILRTLFTENDPTIITSLALNPALSVEDLWVLAKAKPGQAFGALLRNKLVTPGMIEFLATEAVTPGLQTQIAEHPKASNEVLKQMVVQATDDSVVLKALYNRNLRIAEVVRFAVDPDSPLVFADEYIKDLCMYVLQKERKEEFEAYAKLVLNLGDDTLPSNWYIKMLPAIFHTDNSNTVSVWG